MLIEFSAGNYRSFQETVTFSMQAAKLRSKDKRLDQEAVFTVNGKFSLLKSAAIYGANASGKSNLIDALSFMSQMVLSSAQRQSTDPTGAAPFALNTKTEKSPSIFQIIFFINGKTYRYGFEIDQEKVHAEWLYHRRKRETVLFLREGQEFEISNVFKEGAGLERKTRSNALFLSVVDQFNGEIAATIIHWFKHQLRIVSGLRDEQYLFFTAKRMENESFRMDIVAFVKELDVGIIDIQKSQRPFKMPVTADMPEKLRNFLLDPEIIKNTQKIQFDTIHKKYSGTDEAGNGLFALEQESEGTRKLFFLSGLLLDTLNNGAILLIDEFDARLHPLLSTKIISLFNSKETNPHNAQLIFATHDTKLLDKNVFRRDQIWFTEKNRYGATDLYSLAEYSIRNDASYAKDYIAGKYGAIPYLGNIERLFEQPEADDGET